MMKAKKKRDYTTRDRPYRCRGSNLIRLAVWGVLLLIALFSEAGYAAEVTVAPTPTLPYTQPVCARCALQYEDPPSGSGAVLHLESFKNEETFEGTLLVTFDDHPDVIVPVAILTPGEERWWTLPNAPSPQEVVGDITATFIPDE